MNPAPPGAGELFRFESLGDNCELGFVLRKLGHEFGGVLRWARSEPEQILGLLRGDFAGSFAFGNLSAYRETMVLDAANGIGWHTTMFSRTINGRQTFVDDNETRFGIWQHESARMRYLEARFRQRLRLGGSIFVVKSNQGITAETVDALHAALAALAKGQAFSLLEVCASGDANLAGTVKRIGPGLLRGYVARFAPYEDAEAADFPVWTRLLHAALRLQPCPDWPRRLAELRGGAGGVALPFPPPEPPDLSKPIYGDLRTGWVRLRGGNRWCRPVEDGFRLHGPSLDQPPAVLEWQGIRLDGVCRIVARIACPVPDSLPVRLRAQVDDDTGTILAEIDEEIGPNTPRDLVLNMVMPAGRPVNLAITAQAGGKVAAGQRAVVDLTGLQVLIGPETAAESLRAA